MPIYEYECKDCSFHVERIYTIDKKPDTVPCPNCQGKASSVISFTADRKEWNAYWDENLGSSPVRVESREHRRDLMKKAGLQDQYHRKPGMPGQWV